jgi:hypothetical protein
VQKHKRRHNSRRIIWHYTAGVHLPSIIASGVIRRATVGVYPPEKPVTWFSLDPTWEMTASKGPIFSDLPSEVLRDLTHRRYGGLVRIGVELQHAPFGIDDLHRVARCNRQTVELLKRTGIRCGATPSDWRFTPKEVPAALWKSIEIWDGEGRWVPYESGLIVPESVSVGGDIS